MYDYDAPDGSSRVSGEQDNILNENIEDIKNIPYEELRGRCIKSYSEVFRDDFAFDLNMVPKELRVRIIEDPVYKLKTKALRAAMFKSQFHALQEIQDSGDETVDGKDNTRNVLAALQTRNELMFHDLNDGDENNKLNISFLALTREEYEKDGKVELHIGKNASGNLSGGDEMSKEDQFKEKAERIMKNKAEETDDD
jgi:hypothetical protein